MLKYSSLHSCSQIPFGFRCHRKNFQGFQHFFHSIKCNSFFKNHPCFIDKEFCLSQLRQTKLICNQISCDEKPVFLLANLSDCFLLKFIATTFFPMEKKEIESNCSVIFFKMLKTIQRIYIDRTNLWKYAIMMYKA